MDEVTIVGYEKISKNVIFTGRFKSIYVDEGYGILSLGARRFKNYGQKSNICKIIKRNEVEL